MTISHELPIVIKRVDLIQSELPIFYCVRGNSEKTDFSEISTQCASNSRLAALLMLILALAMHQQMTTDKAFDNRQGCSKLGGIDIQGLSKPALVHQENTDRLNCHH